MGGYFPIQVIDILYEIPLKIIIIYFYIIKNKLTFDQSLNMMYENPNEFKHLVRER